jgi:hypothetical protein
MTGRVETTGDAGENNCAKTERVRQQCGDDRGVDLTHPGAGENHVVAVDDAGVDWVCAACWPAVW